MSGENMKLNDKNFIKKLQKGKEEALEWTYDKYIPLVKSIVCKVLMKFDDNGVIEECINDVFLSVWNNCSKFWMYTITFNTKPKLPSTKAA